MAGEMLNNSESNISPDYVSRNLPILLPLPGGDVDACLLETDLLPGNDRSQSLDRLGLPDIEMLEITRAFTSVSSVTNDDLHTLQRCEEKLGEDGSKKHTLELV